MAKPTNKNRLDIDQDKIREVFEKLYNILMDGICPSLVMNLDESGFSEVIDRKEVEVLSPNIDMCLDQKFIIVSKQLIGTRLYYLQSALMEHFSETGSSFLLSQ